MTPLGPALRPCGPVADAAAAGTVRARLDGAEGAFWPALEPSFAASPYLASLAVRDPPRLARLLGGDPDERLRALVAEALACGAEPDGAAAGGGLRRLKAELHLLTALADLGGVWSLDEVTAALSRFADAAVGAALAQAAAAERARGRLLPDGGGGRGPVPGLFVVALGKHGADELNYSSDIDVCVFYEPAALPTAPGVEPQKAALRIVQSLVRTLSERTAEGYVFRTDLRLRPDPASTPPATPVEMALRYYETVGQNWERAALIKARVCAGDRAAGEAFLQALQPFVWRRALDYAAIADIHSIKRQIHAARDLDPAVFEPAGADLKLGPGGIREIEFFVQTQQLILGGRFPALRPRRTLDALEALRADGRVEDDAAAELATAYRRLRGWEHRVQMLHDAQTHVLPAEPQARGAVAALAGADLPAFDAEVRATLSGVNRRYAALFAGEELLSSPAGSLVFTGVEDDPATLATLARMGFAEGASASARVRAWHHGRIAATRTPRGRELWTRLAPRVLEACAATGAADTAFARFAEFFSGLASGVSLQSLLLARPRLLELVVGVLAVSPRLAAVLARRPSALDALLDPAFFAPLDADASRAAVLGAAEAAGGFEAALDAVRRIHRDESFRIGVQVLEAITDAQAAGAAFAGLADACVVALAPLALAEVERLGGAFPQGEVAVVGLGKLGGREMTAASDLDLMTVHRAPPNAVSAVKGWTGETVAARFTQRLTAALSSPTAEGGLYAVDLQLRPSGTAGPVAVSLPALEAYYAGEAQTWELLALTRARVVWSNSAALACDVAGATEAALRRPSDPASTAADVRDMRALMTRERPAAGPWDLKLAPGGLVDVEFAVQHLQLRGAAAGGPLEPNTGAALRALAAADVAPDDLLALEAAWRLQQGLSQVLRLALPAGAADPADQPARLRTLLAAAAGVETWEALEPELAQAQARAHAAFLRITGG